MVGSGRGGRAASARPLFVKIGIASDIMGCVLDLDSLSQFRSLCCVVRGLDNGRNGRGKMRRRGSNEEGLCRSRAGGSNSVGPLFFGVDLPERPLHVLRAEDRRVPPSARGPRAGGRSRIPPRGSRRPRRPRAPPRRPPTIIVAVRPNFDRFLRHLRLNPSSMIIFLRVSERSYKNRQNLQKNKY